MNDFQDTVSVTPSRTHPGQPRTVRLTLRQRLQVWGLRKRAAIARREIEDCRRAGIAGTNSLLHYELQALELEEAAERIEGGNPPAPQHVQYAIEQVNAVPIPRRRKVSAGCYGACHQGRLPCETPTLCKRSPSPLWQQAEVALALLLVALIIGSVLWRL